MGFNEHDVTIAVTVYNRREFVIEAVKSALAQSAPVRVSVVEDCGPDPGLKDFVLREFGSRVEYFRNAKTRGLFGNWNACIESCRTSFLSILHDDDLLRPNFVATMLELAKAAPRRAFYHGQAAVIDEQGRLVSRPSFSWESGWREIDLLEMGDQDFILMFPGNLFSLDVAKQIGGVRPNSYYTGDWDFWFRLAVEGGAAHTGTVVAEVRDHPNARASLRVDRVGWRWALENAQRKRNLAFLAHKKGIHAQFDRTKHLKGSPIPSRMLLRNAKSYSRRILRYNTWLFTHSKAPNYRYHLLQWAARLFGANVLRLVSRHYECYGPGGT